jgi:dienelactone hydrolase
VDDVIMSITSIDIDYYDGSDRLSGVLIRDSSLSGPRPGVTLFHEAWGLNDYMLRRAHMIAELGYVAFAADVFGERRVMNNPVDAMPVTKSYREQPQRLRARAIAAFDTLRAQEYVDAKRIAAIGYCFGGTTSLELARSGAELAAVVSFHGTLASAAPVDQPGIIKSSILVCTGADDPMIPPAQITAFQEEMTKAKADFQILIFGGAVHSFTNPGADALQMPGVAYNADANRRSWAAMQLLFAEAFA